MGLPPSGGVVDGRTGDPSDRSLPAPTPRDQITTPPHNLYRSLAVPDAEKVLQFLFNVNEHTLFFWIIFCNTVARLVLISISKKMHLFSPKNFFLQQLTRAARILMTSRGLVDLEEIVLFHVLSRAGYVGRMAVAAAPKAKDPSQASDVLRSQPHVLAFDIAQDETQAVIGFV